ncbi:hypothetical protein PILCRDRAFT_822621 [Piloderma croceum F 1598]|uniref:Uncharacterized protein n=1 Tax=Piloderma croceum (strain F 1598) TaxID=765440 RepID=A0A0C3B1P3_PILCF|nr:hypothetical protein PILCRDRAFT_822621 [Piloderma croceum F 1598]
MSIPTYRPTQPPVYQPDEKLIPSFDPMGTFAPSYPIKASETATNREAQSISYTSLPAGPAQPMVRANLGVSAQNPKFYSQAAVSPEAGPQSGVRMPQEQLYSQPSFPPQAVVTPPGGVTMPTMGGPHQTDNVTTYYRAGGVSGHSRPPIIAALPQAITTQQRLSNTPSGYFGAPEPYDDAPFDLRSLNSRPTSGYAGSPSRSPFTAITLLPAQNRESVYSSSPLNPATNSMTTMQQVSYLTPQSEVASKSSPYMDAQIPALTTEPKFDWKDNACIVSHDPLLNNDGDALYRFILDHMDAPSVQLHCFGSHVVRELVAHRTADTKRTTVVDFNFVIDLALSMKPGSGELYTCGDDVVTYRGGMVKKVGAKGSPVKTVRDWARNYAASPKTAKEFRFHKVVSGIDMAKIRDAVDEIISSTGYSSFRNVYFTVGNTSIKVQADSTLTRMLTDGLIKYLPWVDLIYPFVWMYRRFGKQGGKWDVCRASFACNRDPQDPHNVIGVPLGDGDWVKIWENTIRLGIRNRIQTTQPIYRPTANDSEVIVFD